MLNGGFKGSFERPPIVISTSRGKLLMALAGLASLALLGYFVALPLHPVLAYLSFACLGVMGSVGIIKLINPDRLRLGPEGFRYGTFLGTVIEAPWSNVGPFRTWAVTHRTAGVIFDVSSKMRPMIRHQGLNKRMTDADVSLAGAWPMSGPELARLLNDAKDHWDRAE